MLMRTRALFPTDSMRPRFAAPSSLAPAPSAAGARSSDLYCSHSCAKTLHPLTPSSHKCEEGESHIRAVEPNAGTLHPLPPPPINVRRGNLTFGLLNRTREPSTP